jgi:hypothetical protein
LFSVDLNLTSVLNRSKAQGSCCHIYHDPIAIYMEDFFTSEFQSISSAYFVFYDSKSLCCEDQTDNQFLVPLQALVLSFVKNNEIAELLDQLLDWLHWNFSIT